ncbi:MAG: hypothetical protein KDA24_12195 [Deltaproteobacteria bacterium]|nr:hypothetical protein [Deltaproteobacteria bacterium]
MSRFSLLLAAALLVPSLAEASPWTLSQNKITFRIGTDFQWAGSEWLINGNYQKFPLRGRYFAANLRGSVRYGVTDRLEIGTELALSHVQYDADELYFGAPLVPDIGELSDRQQIAENITSLDRRVTGVGDVQLYVKYRLTPDTLWRFVATPELHLKIPTGYERPAGTFDDDEFEEGVADDVTLGDGQLDITGLMHFGLIPHPRWFNRLSVGFRLRLFGPGPQVIASYKTGVRIGTFLIPYGEIALTHTVAEGKAVGTTFATDKPETPAAEFTADDLLLLEWRPDRSHLQPRFGVILVQEKWEVDVSYATTVWGINVAQVHSVSAGVTLKL